MTQTKRIWNITISGIMLGLALVLPFLTGQIPQIGSMLSPMHLPIFICGILCGWKYGFIVGFVAPILRYVLFGMPPIYPTGLSMAFELSVYGAIVGIFYPIFKRKMKSLPSVIISLLIAMIFGRITYGVVNYFIALIDGLRVFTFKMFINGALLFAWPGIILQLIIVPLVILGMEKITHSSKDK